jgi:hypothetical protein
MEPLITDIGFEAPIADKAFDNNASLQLSRAMINVFGR